MINQLRAVADLDRLTRELLPLLGRVGEMKSILGTAGRRGERRLQLGEIGAVRRCAGLVSGTSEYQR